MHLVIIITYVKFVPGCMCMHFVFPSMLFACWALFRYADDDWQPLHASQPANFWAIFILLLLLVVDPQIVIIYHAKMLNELHSPGSSSCYKPYMSLMQKAHSCNLRWKTRRWCAARQGYHLLWLRLAWWRIGSIRRRATSGKWGNPCYCFCLRCILSIEWSPSASDGWTLQLQKKEGI